MREVVEVEQVPRFLAAPVAQVVAVTVEAAQLLRMDIQELEAVEVVQVAPTVSIHIAAAPVAPA
jgi:hypothetical protein